MVLCYTFGMINYYHGTQKRNERAIENGWLGTVDAEDNLDLSSGETEETGWVFMTTNRDHALRYGELVFVINTTLAAYWRDCPVTGEAEYRVRANDLNEEGSWWVDEAH